MTDEKGFAWKQEPAAEALLQEFLRPCRAENRGLEQLDRDLTTQTSTRLFDWVDHVVVGKTPENQRMLDEAGFTVQEKTGEYTVYAHPGAQLGRVALRHDATAPVVGVAVKVESCADFLMARGITAEIEGSLFGGYRRCLVNVDNGVSFWVVERRGTLTMRPTDEPVEHAARYLEACEMWQTRPRAIDNEEEAMRIAQGIAEKIVAMHGKGMAAWICLEMERRYWQGRNAAGQVQKNRQDRLGMGWANHDHHTFRSSRLHFPALVKAFEALGFHCRERFYAGEEAGWGAQVMEQPDAGLVLFLDLDLAPEEPHIDFAHQPLPEFQRLGTVGLWCALHGDSMLKAGMHHLEAQFDHGQLTRDLAAMGIGMMDPFSNFPYLKQAFTQGEVWKVDPARIRRLLGQQKITEEEAEKFLHYGAIGSHLENLERNEGYKGFNQKNVSFIITKTDPRKQVSSKAGA